MNTMNQAEVKKKLDTIRRGGTYAEPVRDIVLQALKKGCIPPSSFGEVVEAVFDLSLRTVPLDDGTLVGYAVAAARGQNRKFRATHPKASEGAVREAYNIWLRDLGAHYAAGGDPYAAGEEKTRFVQDEINPKAHIIQYANSEKEMLF